MTVVVPLLVILLPPRLNELAYAPPPAVIEFRFRVRLALVGA
jgi:hypothetical protein